MSAYLASLAPGTLPQWGTFVSVLAIFAGLVGVWIKTGPARQRAKTESSKQISVAEEHLRDDLIARVDKLEEKLEVERADCDKRIERMEERHERAFADLRAEMEEKVGTIRHDRNGLRQVLNNILSGIRKIDHPELRQVASEAEEQLARHDELLALEKGAIVGAKRRPK